MSSLHHTISQSVRSSGTGELMRLSLTAMRTSPPFRFLSFLKILLPGGKIWLSLMLGSSQVYVSKIISGFVLFNRLYSWPCLVLIDWKLTFSIRKVFCYFEFCFFEVSDVDECTGFRFLYGTGLSSGVSESTLKWWDVLKTSEKTECGIIWASIHYTVPRQ